MSYKDRVEWLTWYKEHYTDYVPTDDNGDPVNLDSLLSMKSWFAATKKLSEQLAAEKRKTLELQRVYDERGLQIARLETALERVNNKPVLTPLTFDDGWY